LGKKLAGLEEDAGGGGGGGGAGTGEHEGGGAGTGGRRRCSDAGAADVRFRGKKIRVPPGDKTPGCCIAFP